MNILNGMTLVKARKFLSRNIRPLLNGLYRDDYWSAPKKVWNYLKAQDIDYGIVSAEYKHTSDGIPCSKTWRLDISFNDKAGKERVLRGTLVAHGAGSVKDPLDAYDMTMSIF